MVISYSIPDKLKNSYRTKLSKEKEKLNPESRKFIENVLEGTVKTGKYEHEIFAIAEIKKKIKDIENVRLEDIFPKEIYPALDVMIGKRFRELFIEICEKTVLTPYTKGYYRKMILSSNYRDHLQDMWNTLTHFVKFHILDLDIMKILKREYDTKQYSNVYACAEHYLSAEIDRGNEEVIEFLKDLILSENNTFVLDYTTFRAIFASNNRELVELVGKLLLAAKLQEGLRQAICETMDGGTVENFNYMFKIIYENDLLRFSSVKRALATWTGIGEMYADRVSKKEIEVINKLVENSGYADELLESDDNVEVLLGLWQKGREDVSVAVKAIEKLINIGKRHTILLASYYLDIIQNPELSQKIAKKVIRQNPDDLEIYACYSGNFVGNVNTYQIFQRINSGKVKLTDYFVDENEAKEFFGILENLIKQMTKVRKDFSPCIFPWYSVTLYKVAIADKMAIIALFLKGEYIDKILDYAKFLNYYTKEDILQLVSEKFENENHEKFIVEGLKDPAITNKAFEIAKKHNLVQKYSKEMEGMLRLKTPEVRKNLINLLYLQKKTAFYETVENLIKTKDVNRRLAAFDLILKAKNEKKDDVKTLQKYVKLVKEPTSSEIVLINEINKEEEKSIDEELEYNINYEPGFENKEFLEEKLDIKQIFTKSADELLEIVKKLNDLYVKYENYEYKTVWGEEAVLSNAFSPIFSSDRKYDYKNQKLEDYPLKEVWQEFYKTEIKDFETLYQLYLFTKERFSTKEYLNYTNEMLGFGANNLIEKIIFEQRKNNDLKHFEVNKGYYYSVGKISQIIHILVNEYQNEEKNKKYCYNFGKAVFSYVYNNLEESKILTKQGNNYWGRNEAKETYSCIFDNNLIFQEAKNTIKYYSDDKEFCEQFILKYEIYKKMYNYVKKKNGDLSGKLISLYEFAFAVTKGIIAKDEFYIEVLNRGNAKDNIRTLCNFIYGDEDSDRGEDEQKVVEFFKAEGQKIIDYILEAEFKRGENPVEYSNTIHQIPIVKGVDNLIKILMALGNEKLERGGYYSYYYSDDSKKSNLSHLLKNSQPDKNDTSELFAKKIKGSKISQQRLIEVAMYAPRWIPLIQEYLGWKGMESACYYFHAHISDVSKNMESLFAKYTPISVEDLAVGAFDIDWFKSAYKELGKKRFEMLYEAAKYVSDGAKHSRARMFADAVQGKLKLKETETKIQDKRNKDLVASYSLIPLKKARDKDLLHRYKFLQKFLKESKQFGAQRRASEAKAFEISLENLSRNAGYSDVIRLIWSMETALINEMQKYFEPKKVDEISVFIKIDEFGQTKTVFEKNGKTLKTMPAKLKKNKYIEEIKEVNKNLKEQYRRSKKMLEEAMEDGTEFYNYEIKNLMENPVISPLLDTLVFKSENNLGYYSEGGLVTVNGDIIELKENQVLKIAHALDLYNSGKWSEYQQDLFTKQIKQPFKQVFREIYVKTADEKGKENSLRYAGHQIQPNKTVAVLKNRRWVADYEEGLQKVYYKENIIAKIYAMADWFSPSDIEAPTLEWVCFYDRKTFKPLLIDNIPDLIFTEVMRDVDLAVSVAHVGGVDPEASHSTIEMRKAIVEFNLKLFKLANITFTEKHAIIKGERAEYTVHLGSGVVHQRAGAEINVLPVHSQHRGRIFLPFVDEDPKTAEIMSKIILFAEDTKIKDPFILEQIK
jgi:hypothetical protein